MEALIVAAVGNIVKFTFNHFIYGLDMVMVVGRSWRSWLMHAAMYSPYPYHHKLSHCALCTAECVFVVTWHYAAPATAPRGWLVGILINGE